MAYILFLMMFTLAWGQEDSGLDIVKLKSGEVIEGKIINSSMKMVVFKVKGDTSLIEISRKDIKKISTPFSRTGKQSTALENVNNKTAFKHIYDAGSKFENYVLFSIIGTGFHIGGLYMTLNSLKNGDSPENGILLSGLGSAFSFFGIISIGNAGADLKKASAKIRNENF